MNRSNWRTLWLLYRHGFRHACPDEPTGGILAGWKKHAAEVVGLVAAAILIAALLVGLLMIATPYYLAEKIHSGIEQIDERTLDLLSREVAKQKEAVKQQAGAVSGDGSLRAVKRNIEDVNRSVQRSVIDDARKFNALYFSKTTKATPTEKIAITLPNIAILGPETASTRTLRDYLVKDGRVRVVDHPCDDCLFLQQGKDGWVASLPEKTIKNKETRAKQLKAVSVKLNTLLAGMPTPSQAATPETVKIARDQAPVVVRSVMTAGLAGTIHGIIFGLFMVLALGMGLHGYNWDAQRNRGTLEPIVMTQQPAWVLYGAEMARSIKFTTMIFWAALTPLLFVGPPLHWGLICGMALALPALMLVNGLWGMLACVLFHHRQGRMFARIALSPLTLGVAWGLRVAVVWMAWRATAPFLALGTLDWLDAHWPLIFLVAPGLLLLAALLAWCVHARIGVRREGLRRTA